MVTLHILPSSPLLSSTAQAGPSNFCPEVYIAGLQVYSPLSLPAQRCIFTRVGIPAAGGGWREAVQRLPPEHGVECGRAQIWEKYVSAVFSKQIPVAGGLFMLRGG